MLGAAPKAQVLPTLSLEPAEDRLARAAFGRHGESAAARTNAAHLVRRYQIASGGLLAVVLLPAGGGSAAGIGAGRGDASPAAAVDPRPSYVSMRGDPGTRRSA